MLIAPGKTYRIKYRTKSRAHKKKTRPTLPPPQKTKWAEETNVINLEGWVLEQHLLPLH